MLQEFLACSLKDCPEPWMAETKAYTDVFTTVLKRAGQRLLHSLIAPVWLFLYFA